MVDLRQVIAGDPGNLSQNLISQSKSGRIIRAPGFYKLICLEALAVLSAGFVGFAYYHYLSAYFSIWWVVGAAALWGIAEVLLMFLSKSVKRRSVVLLIEVIALIGFFYKDDVRILIATAFVALVFLVWGYTGSKSILENSIEIQFFRTAGNTLGKLTTAALIFMILLYVPQINQDNVFVSRQSFREFFDWASAFITNWYPSVSLNGSFQTFAQSVAKMELKNNPSFQALPPQEQSTTISQTVTQFENNFGVGSSGQPTASSSPASDAFYNLIVGMLQGAQSQGSPWFIVGWAVVLFLVLRTIGILFVWIVEFIALIIYEILLAGGFMKIAEATQTKELISF